MKNTACDIIMPTYNPKLPLLKRAVESVVSQQFKDWRLFVVRDGGDVDVQVLKSEIHDSRVSIIDLQHHGKSATLNAAIKLGKAKYIAYLDDDDIWYPNHLEEALNSLKENNCRIVHTDAYEVFIERDGNSLKELSRRPLSRGVISDLTLWYVSHNNVVHERSLFDDVGYYDEERPFFIDWDMLIRIASITKPHHHKVFTCEHYVYVDVQKNKTNTISSAHTKNPEFSRAMHDEMFKRAFHLLKEDDFVALARECEQLNNKLFNAHPEAMPVSILGKVMKSFRKIGG